MPNWVENQLLIHGDAAPVLDSIKGTDTPFDFNQVVPMPRELDVESGTKADVALLCAEGIGLGDFGKYPWVKEAGITTPQELCQHYGFHFEDMVKFGQQLLDNIKRFGHPSWYGWRCENWGTKWNACDPELFELQGRSGVLFDTAWSPPIELVRALGRRFPLIEISLAWFSLENEDAGVIRVHGEQGIFKPVEVGDFRPLENLNDLALSWRGPCECKKCKAAALERHSLN